MTHMEPRFLTFNFQNFLTINGMVLLMVLLVLLVTKLMKSRGAVTAPAEG